MTSAIWLMLLTFTFLVVPSYVYAADNLMLGRVVIIKDGKLTKVVGKPAINPFVLPIPDSTSDPRSNPSSLVVADTGGPGVMTDGLTAGEWKGLGNPPGSKGYKYKNLDAPVGGPVKLAIIKSTVVKIVAKDDGSLDGPVAEKVAVTLQLGADARYCAEFGGVSIRNLPGLVKRVDAFEPIACYEPPATTTSSSIIGSSTTTSSTIAIPCCGGASFHSFTTGNVAGDCGDIVNSSGASPFGQLACGGLYLGGGQNTTSDPSVLPDLTQMVTTISSCVGDTATLGQTTAGMTGSTRNCTAPGCSFGAPVPITIPEPVLEDTLFCLVGTVAGGASGSLDCTSGVETLNLLVSWDIYQDDAGDGVDPSHVIPGSQPCPICQAGTCVGGPNNGMACTPGTNDLGDAFPTSQDCPPPAASLAGTSIHNLQLTTNTVTWTATPATNDTETEPNQSRVFAGYCRDSDGSGDFEIPPRSCWENGLAVGAPCTGTYETCEQRNNGAFFGPGGGAVMTISAVGSPQTGISSGVATGTLVALFSSPPILAGGNVVDNSLDLPGPGALTLPGTGVLCAVANPCP